MPRVAALFAPLEQWQVALQKGLDPLAELFHLFNRENRVIQQNLGFGMCQNAHCFPLPSLLPLFYSILALPPGKGSTTTVEVNRNVSCPSAVVHLTHLSMSAERPRCYVSWSQAYKGPSTKPSLYALFVGSSTPCSPAISFRRS